MTGLLKLFYIEDSPTEDEFTLGVLPENKDLGRDPTFSQVLVGDGSQDQILNPGTLIYQDYPLPTRLVYLREKKVSFIHSFIHTRSLSLITFSRFLFY